MSFKGLALIKSKRRRLSQQDLRLQQSPQNKNNSLKQNEATDLKYKKMLMKPLTIKRGQARKSSIDFVQSIQRQSLKRNTNWEKNQLDKLQFQLKKPKKQLKHKHIKSMEVNFSENRHLKPQKLKIKIKQGMEFIDETDSFKKGLSLKREGDQIQILKNQLDLTIKQLSQERLKFKLISQLIKTYYIEHMTAKKSIQNVTNQNSIEENQIQVLENHIDNINKSKNQMISKIRAYFKQIILLRSQRVVYSSIFKDIQKEIKNKELLYNKILINSYQAQKNLKTAKQFYEKSKLQKSLNNVEQFNYSLLNWNQIKDLNIRSSLSQESSVFQQKINKNSALNYYTQSRKVIILPRYKQHHNQSSRKKIDLQKSIQYYEQIIQKINSVYLAFGLIDYKKVDNQILDADSIGDRKTEKNQRNRKGTYQNFKIIKRKMQNTYRQNDAFYNQIILIDQKTKDYQTLLKEQIEKFKSKQFTKNQEIQTTSVITDPLSSQRGNQVIGEDEEDTFNLVKKILQSDNSEDILTKIDFVNYQYIINVVEPPLTTDRNTNNSSKSCMVTQRSSKNPKSKRDVFQRGQKALDSILSNIKIYQNYERAFQRMDFQQQYQTQKNKKKRTLIRRPAMLQEIVKKQSNTQKNKYKKQNIKAC